MEFQTVFLNIWQNLRALLFDCKLYVKRSYTFLLLYSYEFFFFERVYLYYSALWSLLFPSIVKLQKSSFCQVNTEEASHKHSAPPVCFSCWKILSKAEKAIWQFWQQKAPLTACLTDLFFQACHRFPRESISLEWEESTFVENTVENGKSDVMTVFDIWLVESGYWSLIYVQEAFP